MRNDTTYDLLYSRRLITLIGPIPDPPLERRSPNWSPHAHCKYLQGIGHFTDDCWKIKEVVQGLIDDNLIPVPLE